jgi:hypothetical protein
MDTDPFLPEGLCDKNVIESVSGISNVYTIDNEGNMFTGSNSDDRFFCEEDKKPSVPNLKDKQGIMKERFAEWKIDLRWVILFPHVDDFNARGYGQNFLGAISRTVQLHHKRDTPHGFYTKQRQTMTFCQRKVHEDAEVREACAILIHDGIESWCKKLPKDWTGNGILEFAWKIHWNVRTKELAYQATNENKCMYYSLFCSNH